MGAVMGAPEIQSSFKQCYYSHLWFACLRTIAVIFIQKEEKEKKKKKSNEYRSQATKPNIFLISFS